MNSADINVIHRTGKPDIVDCEQCHYHMLSRSGVLLAGKHIDRKHPDNPPAIAIYNDDTYSYDRKRHDPHHQRACAGPDRPGQG